MKDQAAKHRRSIGKEALVLLEVQLDFDTPKPFKLKFQPPIIKWLSLPDGSPEAVVAATHDGQA